MQPPVPPPTDPALPPDGIDWDDADDTLALLDWLEQQPGSSEDSALSAHAAASTGAARTLPALAYGIQPDDTAMRTIGGLLAIHQQRGDDEAAVALIRRLLRKGKLEKDKLDVLLAELERYEDRQREDSRALLESFDAAAQGQVYAPPETLPSQPYFAAYADDAGDHGVVFAVEMTAAQPLRNRPPVEAASAELLLALHHAADHAADRHGLGVDLGFAWRIISEAQALNIALLVRVGGIHTAAAAEQVAAEAWHTIEGLLPLHRVAFVYRPVTDPQRLAWLRRPAELNSVFAVTRQEYRVEHEGKQVYSVGPLGAGEGDRQALLAEMLRQPGIAMLDVQVTPTHWRPDEREAVREMLQNGWGNTLLNQPDSLGSLLKRLDDSRYLRAVETYTRTLDRDLMFNVRITVASSETMAATALPVVTALNLFGTSRYEIRPAALPEEREAAAQHLESLSGADWPRSSAPAGLERLLHLWTPDETLAAVRLPVPGPSGLPGVDVQQVKITNLPPGLPTEGLLLGDSYDPTLNRVQPIYLPLSVRSRHAYIVGRTGTGKTTLLENMALQDIRAGRGVGIIDPHGDLIESILARIPPERARDVVLFDPGAAERPVGLNILDVEGDFEKNMVISEFMGLLYSIYDPGRTGIVGPRFEQAVRNAMHTAMAVKGSTMIDVMRILSNRNYTRACLDFVTDPMVRAYYKDIVDGQSDFHKSEVLDYITSKFGRFTGDTAIRNVIGQSKTTIDFGRIMDEGKILLVNLAKGRIGQENSRFLGLLLVPRILIAAFSRAKQPVDQRRAFYLYIDEFHNFTTPMLSTMLSEGRKYGLSLTLANQFISQLTDDTREAVFGNVGTLGAFQVGVRDAYMLAQEFYPVFTQDDLVNFPAYHMALKLPLGGASGRPFMLKTRPSAPGANLDLAEAVREYSLLHYGRDTVVIDAEIRHRFDTPPQPRVAL